MWLPDAMEGPTPVSALIHAATMVTAGVYLVARSAPIIHFSPSTQWVIACIGAATALFAATIACAQDDIKRVLAYSTISQLGYMFLAEGSGGYDAGIYHTIMHAFFKAALFLSAGAVIHALHDEQNMKRMGGLWRYLPITRLSFIAGFLALAAIPPFDGFWSKDDVLQAAWHKSPALWVIGVVTAGLTAYYMSRQVMLVFGGQSRWVEHTAAHGAAGTAGAFGSPDSGHGEPGEHGAGAAVSVVAKPHEAPWVMTLPLIVLGIASTIGWLINAPFGGLDFLSKWLAPVFPTTIAPAIQVSTGTKWAIGVIATGVAFIGLFIGLRVWVRGADQPALEPAVLTHGWYIDEGVAAAVSGPVTRVANDVGFGVDIGFIDATVNGVAWLTAQTGRQLRRLQTGYVRNYALGIGLGAVVILAYFATRVGS
jgi:NADH-quinone oxidoreductase subunit L